MIHRAALPEHSFLILRNSVARDANLSYRASGVLADILSRPDSWIVSAESLARARPKQEGVKALRTVLTELERAGYLRRVRTRRGDGKFGWAQEFWDVPQSWSTSSGDVSAGGTISPKPPGGLVPGGFGPSKEELLKENCEEDGLDMACTTSSRFAPSGGGDSEDPKTEDSWTDPWAVADEQTEGQDRAEERGSWRVEDRAAFVDLVGEKITTFDHRRWREGTFAALAFYMAFRKRKRNPILYPGRYVTELYERGQEQAIDDWLTDQGLERADQQ